MAFLLQNSLLFVAGCSVIWHRRLPRSVQGSGFVAAGSDLTVTPTV